MPQRRGEEGKRNTTSIRRKKDQKCFKSKPELQTHKAWNTGGTRNRKGSTARRITDGSKPVTRENIIIPWRGTGGGHFKYKVTKTRTRLLLGQDVNQDSWRSIFYLLERKNELPVQNSISSKTVRKSRGRLRRSDSQTLGRLTTLTRALAGVTKRPTFLPLISTMQLFKAKTEHRTFGSVTRPVQGHKGAPSPRWRKEAMLQTCPRNLKATTSLMQFYF